MLVTYLATNVTCVLHPFTSEEEVGRLEEPEVREGWREALSLDVIGPLNLLTHSNCNYLHKASTQPSQSILQHGLGRGAGVYVFWWRESQFLLKILPLESQPCPSG